MTAHLLIRDGNTNWWLSPDIWVVPGTDPNGATGSPVAGQPAYLWAHVANTGDTDADGARIDFYWANPAMQIIIGAATLIGSAYADLPAGGAQDVLCLVPWTPTFVNGGHECVVAVAHSQDEATPLPDPLPNGFDFNPPAHDEIAQRNLSVLVSTMFELPVPITVFAPPRQDKEVVVTFEYGGLLDERLLGQLGLRGFHLAPQEAVEVRLGHEPRCHPHEWAERSHDVRLRVAKGTSSGLFLTVRGRHLERHQYLPLNIIEWSDGRPLGGITYVAAHQGSAEP